MDIYTKPRWTVKRDHSVGRAVLKGDGYDVWYECSTCGEIVDRKGAKYAHRPVQVR